MPKWVCHLPSSSFDAFFWRCSEVFFLRLWMILSLYYGFPSIFTLWGFRYGSCDRWVLLQCFVWTFLMIMGISYRRILWISLETDISFLSSSSYSFDFSFFWIWSLELHWFDVVYGYFLISSQWLDFLEIWFCFLFSLKFGVNPSPSADIFLDYLLIELMGNVVGSRGFLVSLYSVGASSKLKRKWNVQGKREELITTYFLLSIFPPFFISHYIYL